MNQLTVSEPRAFLLPVQLSMQSLASAINEFHEILAVASADLSRISDAEASVASAPGHWSRKQILGHLLDSASNNHHRFVWAQVLGAVTMPAYMQAEWVSAQHYQGRAWKDLIAFWTAYNTHLLYLMQQVPKDCLQNSCHIGDDEPVTLEFLMIDYVAHLRHHWNQILAPLAASI